MAEDTACTGEIHTYVSELCWTALGTNATVKLFGVARKMTIIGAPAPSALLSWYMIWQGRQQLS
jgi:hypothetical protein